LEILGGLKGVKIFGVGAGFLKPKQERSLKNVTPFQGRNQLFISGGQFSLNFIWWCHRAYATVVQLFRKQSQIKLSSQHFRK